jgi:Uma2 family endonuclease
MTVAANQTISLEDYLRYDDGTDTRYELVDGMLVQMGAESPINNTIALFLVLTLAALGIPAYRFATGHQIEVDSERATARQPDLMVHTEASARAILDDGNLLRLSMPAPMLIVEVVSSSDTDKKSRDRDYIEKFAEYAARGIPEYWIIDPIEGIVSICKWVGISYQMAEFQNDAAIISPTFPALKLTTAKLLAVGL